MMTVGHAGGAGGAGGSDVHEIEMPTSCHRVPLAFHPVEPTGVDSTVGDELAVSDNAIDVEELVPVILFMTAQRPPDPKSANCR